MYHKSPKSERMQASWKDGCCSRTPGYDPYVYCLWEGGLHIRELYNEAQFRCQLV